METKETPNKAASIKVDFYRRFQHEETVLQEQMTRLKDATLQEIDRASLTAQCQSTISQLSDLVKDTSIYLPAYDQRTYSTLTRRSRT
ncbi:hypothetical protein ABVK25_001986 [Lepraria finkii]|uniref:Tubulin-specific chaperone C N-terminal domain-containing protein n=1 Tax=Lepraria finkii TaxID=1340010 RepID=A0ABR4BJL3_9LECA